MNLQLRHCSLFHDCVALLKLYGNDINEKEHIFNAVLNNYKVIAYNTHWSQLEFLEALSIKNLRPEINDGLKASRELQLFR